jgi:hypothetical protein
MRSIKTIVLLAYIILATSLAGCQMTTADLDGYEPVSSEQVAIPDDEDPTELAARMRACLAGLDELTVDSRQRVSYLNLDDLTPEELAAPEKNAVRAMQMHPDKVVSVDVRIHAEMTPDSFTVTVWRGNEERPIAINSMAVRDGVPYITERQWHPILGDYREVSYPSPHAYGYDDATVQSVLFENIHSTVCATAEFFHTWLADTGQADTFEQIIAEAKIIHAPLETAAPGSLRLHRRPYKGDREGGFSSCDQYFMLSLEPPLLLEWSDELVALKYDKSVFAYMTVERTYSYPATRSESEHRSGIASKPSSDK